MLFEHVALIRRNIPVGTNGRKQMADYASGVPCLVLPMATSASISAGFSLGRGYDIYFNDGQDVKVGDRVVANDMSFMVKATQPYALPLAGHVRALCEEEVQ